MDNRLNQKDIFSTLAVWDASGWRQQEAHTLAQQLALPVWNGEGDSPADLLLVLTAERLELHSQNREEGGPIFVDFVQGKAGYRRQHGGGWRQPLVRAVGLRPSQPLRIVDATAGLGQDAFVLAALGGVVTMLERSSVLSCLLADGLRRLAEQSRLQALPQVTLTLQTGDARHLLAAWGEEAPLQRPEVIYLDPMYPHRPGSALVKKEMRRLRRLVGDDTDADALLLQALPVATRRVVVKRPRAAPVLAGQRPTMSLESNLTRYDIYRLA
ncbi:MAG: class I SAM-dependent methyltransferase [Magnetococcales bacterium]|nr:class I SAM-dependent methyltransferase [Magnetococcales bacterium]